MRVLYGADEFSLKRQSTWSPAPPYRCMPLIDPPTLYVCRHNSGISSFQIDSNYGCACLFAGLWKHKHRIDLAPAAFVGKIRHFRSATVVAAPPTPLFYLQPPSSLLRRPLLNNHVRRVELAVPHAPHGSWKTREHELCPAAGEHNRVLVRRLLTVRSNFVQGMPPLQAGAAPLYVSTSS